MQIIFALGACGNYFEKTHNLNCNNPITLKVILRRASGENQAPSTTLSYVQNIHFEYPSAGCRYNGGHTSGGVAGPP